MFTDTPANRTFLVLQIKAGFRIYIGNQRNRLGKIDMDGFVQRKILIVRIRDFYRTVLDTGRTPRATLLDNVSWFFDQGNREFTGLSFHALDFGVGQDLDIGMPAAFNEFRRLNAHGAVIGGKGLVELGHLAANGRRFVHQENLEPRFGKIESGLDATDSTPDNQHIDTLVICGTVIWQPVNCFFFQFHPSLSG